MTWDPELEDIVRRKQMAARLGGPLLESFEAIRSPLRTAEAFDIVEIIDPRDTRPMLCEWVPLAYATERTRLGPKQRGFRP